MNIKHVKVEYIESGTFQGGEEDTSKAGINYGEECVVISKANFKLLKNGLKNYNKLRDLVLLDFSGDLDFIKYQINEFEQKK